MDFGFEEFIPYLVVALMATPGHARDDLSWKLGSRMKNDSVPWGGWPWELFGGVIPDLQTKSNAN